MTMPRDEGVDAAWREHLGSDGPPAALDDAILAAAHRAVASGPQPLRARARWRAYAPLAAAATLAVVAFVIVRVAPVDRQEVTVASDVPATPAPAQTAAAPAAPAGSAAPVAPAEPAARAAPAAPAPPAAPSPSSKPETVRRAPTPASPAQAPAPESVAGAPAPQAFAVPEPFPGAANAQKSADAANVAPAPATAPAAPPASASAPAPEPTPDTRDRAATSNNAVARKQAPSMMAARPPAEEQAVAPSAARETVSSAAPSTATGATPSAARRATPGVTRSVDDYVRELRTLRAAQRDDEAARVLAAFRAAYPDADQRLPDDLKGWARGVAAVR